MKFETYHKTSSSNSLIKFGRVSICPAAATHIMQTYGERRNAVEQVLVSQRAAGRHLDVVLAAI